MSKAGIAALLLLAAVVVALFVLGRRGYPEGPPNVVLIAIDTLRADHTSLHGEASRQTTPNLAKLATRATVFQNATSQAPWTMPAFASIMTGLYPAQHGATSLSGRLSDDHQTLSEILGSAGYDTAAIVSHLYVNAKRGFAQGFASFDESNILGAQAITSDRVTNLALKYLDDAARSPFFLFLHYFDPHYEYRNHQGYDYADDYDGWLHNTRWRIGHLRKWRDELTPEDVDHLRNLYDEEIAFTDAQIGRVLDYLEQSDLDQNTVIIVVSDHGEEFMERGWLGHTITLHHELVHVPLIVALPRGDTQTTTVRAPVETRSIFATVLHIVGLGAADAEQSLLPLMRGQTNSSPTPHVFTEVWLPDGPTDKKVRVLGVRNDRWKFTNNLTTNAEALYDLTHDPDERTNLVETNTTEASELRRVLSEWSNATKRADDSNTIEMTDQQLEQLRSLGYIHE